MANQDKWMTSVWASLSDHLSLTRSISVVPENLKKWNEDAYMPKVVSIGPRFKGTREEFLLMEQVKLTCMLSLLSRAEGPATPDNLQKSSNVVWENVEIIRASYMTKINLGTEELASIMLVDGCFLLELLISKGLDSELPNGVFSTRTTELLKDEFVLSDLMLFENQIPISVLIDLSRALFPRGFQRNTYDVSLGGEGVIRDQMAKKINDLALSVLGYSPLELPCPEAHHILDLVHFSVNRTTVESTTMPGAQQEERVNMDSINTTQSRQQKQLKLKRCALRLLTSGITIKVKLPEDSKTTDSCALSCFSWMWNGLCAILSWLFFMKVNKHFEDEGYIHELKGLDFWFKFEKGKLEIEQLHITKTTKAKWCNIIASEEHHRRKRTIFQHMTGYEEIVGSGGIGGGKFTLAALIFDSLVCSVDDVQLLKDKKIVVDHLKMTNQELMDFFRKIALGVDHGVVSSSNYIQMVDDINNFSKAFLIKRICSTVLNSFRYRQEWLFRFLNRNYNFVATVVFILTVVQTVYSILAYYFPK